MQQENEAFCIPVLRSSTAEGGGLRVAGRLAAASGRVALPPKPFVQQKRQLSRGMRGLYAVQAGQIQQLASGSSGFAQQ